VKWALPPTVLALLGLTLALPVSGAGEVYKWVDKDGQTHISTDPPPKGAKRPSSPAPERMSFVYQWKDKGGRFHITTEAPPPGAKLVEKFENPRTSEAPVVAAIAADVQSLRSPRAVGARAPEIDGYNSLGDPISTADLRGRPLWITFSTKFCRYCAEEAKVMAELAGVVDDAVFLVVLGVDGDIKTAKKWAERYGLNPADVVAGTPEIFPMGPVPHNVFIDRLGRVTSVRTGALSPKAVRHELQRLR